MSPIARRIAVVAALVSALGGGIYFMRSSNGGQEPAAAQPSPAPEPPRDRKAAEAAWAKGIAALEAGDAAGSIKLLDQAVAADRSFPEAYVARGSARIATGEFDGAITDFDQALTIDPRQAEARSGKGMVFWLRGDLADAEREFAGVTALRPNDRSAAVRYAVVLYDQDKKQQVRNFYEDAYRQNPNRDWVVAGLLGAVRANQPDEASGYEAGRARAMSMWYDGVKLPEVSQMIGMADLYSHRYDEAISWLEPLVAEDPNAIDTDVIAQLAVAYRESGKPDQCSATWNDYLNRMGRSSAMTGDHDPGAEMPGVPDAETVCNPQPAAAAAAASN